MFNPEKEMRILIINYEYPPLGGGGGVATRDLAVEWAKKAHVDVITSSFRNLKKFETIDNVNIHRVKIFFRKSRDAATFLSMLTYLPGAFIKGFRLLRKNKYTVINTHFVIPSGPVGYLLGKLFHIPNVISLHGGEIYDPSKKMSPHRSRFWSTIVRFLLNRGDALVAQSSNTRDNAFKYYNPDKNIDIIPLPFNPPGEITKTRKELNLNPDDFLIITCGRLVKRKAVDILIQCLSKIKHDNIKLLVMGDGPEKNNLEKLCTDLDLDNNVIFLGFVSDDDKYEFLKAADVFALTSIHEGFGIVFMEAMYCGLPIICTNVGGQTDFLTDGQNAKIIEVGDINACAESINDLQINDNMRNKLGKNNIEKVKSFYAGPVAGQYLKLFSHVAAGKN